MLIFKMILLIYLLLNLIFQKTRDKSTCTNLAAVIHACIAPKSGKHLVTKNTFNRVARKMYNVMKCVQVKLENHF